MLRKIYNFIDDHIRDNMVTVAVCFIIGAIIGITLILNILDFKPATESDYMPLIEQKDVINENFNSIYSYDNYSISPSDDNIKVTLKNEQCEIICIFDNKLNYVNHYKKDLAVSYFELIFLCLFMGVVITGAAFLWTFAIIIPFILSWLLKFLEWVCLFLVGRRN